MAKAKKYNDVSQYEDEDVQLNASRVERLGDDPDIWEKMAEEELYTTLREMGNTEALIKQYQKNRVFQTGIVFVILMAIAIGLKQPMVFALAIGISIFVYRSRFTRIRKVFGQWKFERELNFSKFIRLLIPYLKQSGGDASLYTVFNKILIRLDDDTDIESLYMLMGDMAERPGDIEPFYSYARRSSGSDMAYLIMGTVFDYQQSTRDTTVINELGQMASEQMMDAIDEIIAFKIRRFGMFPTKIVMSSFILVVGFAAGVMLQQIAEMGGLNMF